MSTTVGKLSVELGISDDQLRAGLAAAMVQAQQAGQKISQSMNQAGQASAKTGSNMNMAILQASRGIQDFQAAGLMGIVNNVEGIASAFGLGAGVAGMVTLAAVAIQSLTPAIKSAITEAEQFFGVWKSESEKAAVSVGAFMGGGGRENAMAEALRQQAEFLKNRTDDASGFNIDFISRAVGLGSNEERALANNMRRGVEATALMSQAFEQAAQGSKELAAAQRGAAAKLDQTTSQKEQTGINRLLFQAALDASGGGENLRTRIEMAAMNRGMNRTQGRELYGGFAAGDLQATQQVESMLNLATEKAKVLADDFEKATGSAAELARIEKEQNQKIGEEIDKMVKDELERQALQARASKMETNLADLEARRMRSEIIGASDVFNRNFNAGLEKDPTVQAIEKQTEELKEVMESLKELN